MTTGSFHTGSTNFSDTVQALVSSRLEEVLRAELPFGMNGSFDALAHVPGTNRFTLAGFGDVKYVGDSSTILVEGTTPDSEELTINIDQFSGVQRAKLLGITDLSIFESVWDLANVAADKTTRWLAEAVSGTIQSAIDVYADSASAVIYADGATSRVTTSSPLTAAFLRTAVGRLRQANVHPYPDGFYRLVTSPRGVVSISSETAYGGFIDSTRFVDNTPLLAGQVGDFLGCHILETSLATTIQNGGADSADIFRTVIYGPGAVALGDLQTCQTIYTPPGGQGDPVNQKAWVAAKCWLAGGVLLAQGPKLVVIESTGPVLADGQS